MNSNLKDGSGLRDQNILPPEEESAGGLAETLNATGTPPSPPALWVPPRHALLRWLERPLLWVEKLINRLVGAPQLNPFYYTGSIAVFLFGIISVTGLFLVLFFQVGFDSSYIFISRVESQFVTRIVRAAHRYASDALVIVSVLHAYRLLVLERFRGARWLAWVSGVVMLLPVWFAGVTGYWMVWDERALTITTSFDQILQRGASSVLNLIATNAKGNSWIFIMILLLAHLALSVVIGVAIWAHVARLNRPKWMPARYWLIGLTVVVLGVSALVPVGMLPKANLATALTSSPPPFALDLIYLFYIPLAFNTALNSPWVWIGLLVALALVAALPWLGFCKTQTPFLAIDKAKCNGCTLCAVDCPYKAITMEPRTDGSPHKFVALEHTDLCVSCGICVGSCDSGAITLGNVSTQSIWNAVNARLARVPDAEIVLTCERHAASGAKKLLREDGTVQIVALPCVGVVYPDLVGKIRLSGSPNVRLVGCPPEDCANREGNTWALGRLTRQRLPRLRKIYGDEPIAMRWIAPDEFARALTPPADDASMTRKLTWRNFVPAFVLLALILFAQIWLTTPMFKP